MASYPSMIRTYSRPSHHGNDSGVRGQTAAVELLTREQPQARLPPQGQQRFTEPLKFLPIAFVSGTILSLYLIYVFCHCLPLLQIGERPERVDTDAQQRGWFSLFALHGLTGLVVFCYVKAILIHPGSVPDGDPYWDRDSNAPAYTPNFLQEKKQSGERRHCKWCNKYKPDRCHHCRVCRTCILKMDHHCPWIYNCVGFWNYKFFFLLLLYSGLDCLLITSTMFESVQKSMTQHTPFSTMFMLFFGETLAALLALFLTLFVSFHVWLMLKALTTIEFCEKLRPRGGEGNNDYISAYDLRPVGNIEAVLGENPLCWLLPCGRPPGDGLSFAPAVVQAHLANRLEAERAHLSQHQQDQGTPAQEVSWWPTAQQRYGTM